MDLQVALTALLARFPDLHLAVAEDELQWKTGMAVRGPVALPIGWRGSDERVLDPHRQTATSARAQACAPKHFRLDDGRSRPMKDVIDPDDIVLDAADTCPTEAIAVDDAAGRQIAP
jgi:hypothetical protein